MFYQEAVIHAVNSANLYRYIAKPWDPTDLALTIKEAVRRYFQDKAVENQNKLLRNMTNTLELKVKERTAELEAQKLELKTLNASKDKFFYWEVVIHVGWNQAIFSSQS